MINIRMDMIDFSMDMDGHADADKVGEYDLVCAAASTIGQWLLQSLENYDEAHSGLIRLDWEMKPGILHLRAKAKEWARASVRARFVYALEGFEMLEDRYPENIHVEEE